MVCAPVSDARVPCCVCRQVVIGAVDAPPKSKKTSMAALFGGLSRSCSPSRAAAAADAKNSTDLAAGVAPRGGRVVAHVLK